MTNPKQIAKNKVIAVNKNDRKIGLVDKIKAHLGDGILHRAIMVFIFNSEGDLLIQKRSSNKMLWPNFWDSTCATHPLDKESYEKCGQRRLKEELGFTCSLKYLDKFHYQAKYKNIGSEKEICAILVGFYNGKIKPNKKEVSQTKWINFEQLLKEIKSKPDQFTPWLKVSLEKYLWPIRKERLKIIFQNLSWIVEPEIKKILAKDVSRETAKMLAYSASTGGKRLRPGMAILSCLALGGKLKDVLQPAAGLEILHNYTLIVDDTIDHGTVRRNQDTLQKKYGLSITECLAVDYAASIFQSIENHPQSKIISSILAQTIKMISEGETLDILFEQAGREDEPYIKKNRYLNISWPKYLKMISQKTATLFQTAVEIGAICANTTSKQIETLKNYGLNLGIAFQIRDDILDIFGEEKKFGKKIGKDIEERKGGNIIILLADQEFSLIDKNKFQAILRKKRITKRDVKQAIQMIKKTKAKEKAQSLGEKFTQKAKKYLDVLPQNKWISLLKEIADFVIEREY